MGAQVPAGCRADPDPARRQRQRLADDRPGHPQVHGHARIAQHFGRPSTPTDQAWIEPLNGTIKGECPHLLAITDPAVLRAELELVRTEYNTVRLHSGVGYVTPADEHTGRGEAIRSARRQGLHQARTRRLAHHRRHRDNQ